VEGRLEGSKDHIRGHQPADAAVAERHRAGAVEEGHRQAEEETADRLAVRARPQA
jgi:hypothetical protein